MICDPQELAKIEFSLLIEFLRYVVVKYDDDVQDQIQFLNDTNINNRYWTYGIIAGLQSRYKENLEVFLRKKKLEEIKKASI
jgi:hypothetical protein